MYRNLQNLLDGKCISCEDFARLLGVSTKTAYNKLQGKSDFTLGEVKKINRCMFPEYNFDYLFTEDSSRKDASYRPPRRAARKEVSNDPNYPKDNLLGKHRV